MKLATFLILGALMLPGQEPQTRKQKIDARKIETNERRERRAAETRARREELAEKTRIRREASRVASAARSNRYDRSSGYNRWAPQQITASQEGSVAIAKNAAITVDPVDCIERAVKVSSSADKAFAYCEKIFDREAKRSEKVSNEGADGTKNSRPLVILPRRGW